MPDFVPAYATLADWISYEAIPFSLDSPDTFSIAVDKIMALIGDSVELLGFGEALHGGECILKLRNQLFRHLVEKHGYSAIAIESSFPRARIVNDYVNGHGPESYDDVKETGFSHGFGRLEANRELVEWMREYNADISHKVKVQFYGFDSPTEMMYADSPRSLLYFVLNCLSSIDDASGKHHREQIEPFIGNDADWENFEAAMDPSKSVGLSSDATALRIATEDLISELTERRPELIAKSDNSVYNEAVQYATMARKLLNYHALMACDSDDRLVRLLGIRDAIMADNLVYIVSKEHDRGKVLAFAHNSHLKRGKAHMQLGPYSLAWWPAGSHLTEIFGKRYAVIGSAVGFSEENGIGQPEGGTLEAILTGLQEQYVFIPTHKGRKLQEAERSSLKIRIGSMKNPTYFPFTSESFTDFDWLAFLNSTTYSRGGPQLP